MIHNLWITCFDVVFKVDTSTSWFHSSSGPQADKIRLTLKIDNQKPQLREKMPKTKAGKTNTIYNKIIVKDVLCSS